ncbi:MAG: putative sugar nucleotidyl transferase, partial [Chitinophagales bacterium]
MADFQIVLVDHYSDWSNLRPLTLTRPVSHLRVGILRIFEKWEHFFKQKVQVKSCVDYLQSMSNFSPNTQEAFCYINSTILPTPELCGAIQNLKAGDSLYADGILLASMVNPTEGHFENEVYFDEEIIRIDKPWTIFQQNEKAIELDFTQITKGRKSQTLDTEANLIVGKESLQRIFVEEGAEVNGAILSPKNGYIYVGKNAEIMEGAVVRGSLAMCEGAVLKLAAKIYGATTIGPYSKVGGEVNNSVIQG